ncbi:hypothetical protein ACDA63_18205 [Uliginosibacterium sp. sgz301328]|uniref:hypothetical protein n=1 Tax=Uliginosibacterium sp. sgz301328 TaxID=3243764 RepID=UPI00359DDF53
MARWLHYIDEQGLQTWRANGAGMRSLRAYPANEAGVQAFGHWLRDGGRRGVHTLLVEVPDEDFKNDAIPSVTGADRRALLERKLQQNFFGTPYATTISLGRESDGRRDERVLYAALTRPQTIEPWIGALRMHGAAVSAILTPSLLTGPLLAALRPPTGRGLLITLSPAGVRQIFIDEGRLKFSRLSQRANGDFSQWGVDCVREAQKLYQYLQAQRWLPRGARLPVWVLLHRNDALREEDPAEADNLDLHAFDIQALASQLGVRDTLADSDSRPIFLRLAQRASNVTQLAPAADTRYFRLRRARNAIVASGVLAFAMLSTAAVISAVDVHRLRTDAERSSQDALREEARYRELVATLPQLPASLETLRDVVSRIDERSTQAPDMRTALTALSRALDRFPEIELDRVEWRIDNAGADADPRSLPAKAPTQTTVITAHLPDSAAGDPRTTLSRIRDFANSLRQDTGAEVTLPRLPFDAESNKTLRSERPATSTGVTFEMRFVLPGGTR